MICTSARPLATQVSRSLLFTTVLVLCAVAAQAEPVDTVADGMAFRRCVSTDTALCLQDGRFTVTLTFEDAQGGSGDARVVDQQSDDAGLFWFYRASNWEMLVKVLDGCGVNGHYWVFAAGTTNVGYEMTARDRAHNTVRRYSNRVGRAASSLTDTAAFPCDGPGPGRRNLGARLESLSTVATAPLFTYAAVGACVENGQTLCLAGGRFQVRLRWETQRGENGPARVVPVGSNNSGLLWFFNRTNWEMLVKALNGCGVNGHFWVFAAATTNVGYSLEVTDTQTGAQRIYANPVGRPSPPILDTAAFPCNAPSSLPADPGPANDNTLAGIDSDRDGLRDDVERYIGLTYGVDTPLAASLTQTARAALDGVVGTGEPAVETGSDLMRAGECLRHLAPGRSDELTGLLLAEVLDTEERLLEYLELSRRLGGQAFPVRPPGEWGESCQFDPANPGRLRSPAVIHVPASACVTPETTVVYANGMRADYTSAGASTEALAALFGDLPAGRARFLLAYNSTGGFWADLWQAARQNSATDSSSFYRWMAGIGIVPGFFRNLFLEQAVQKDRDSVAADPEASGHLALYRNELLEGKKVVIVAHSQGNFYANLTRGAMTAEERRSVGVVGVANPDSFVSGGGFHLTLTEDKVIKAARLIFNPMPANVTNLGNPGASSDWFHHEFIGAYLRSGTNSRQRLREAVAATEARIETPAGQASDGVITVTLTWGSQPDVDLHVVEPNGTHVYFGNKVGRSGFLDVDDTSGFGPEHYYVSCDNLETGIYAIGVNYFRGFGVEQARIQVKAGLEVQRFSQTLTRARGFAGTADPIPQARIRVTGSEADGFSLNVEAW